MHKVIRQKFSAHFEYPVIFSRNVFGVDNHVLKDLLCAAVDKHPHAKILVYIDAGVAGAIPETAGRITGYLTAHVPGLAQSNEPKVVQGGESIKSNRVLIDQLLLEMADAKLDRHSFVMAVGGGAVLDAVGYAASLVHRGVRMIRLPTTVLAQNDAGVGVKTAINNPAGKNFFGTFAPPWAVVNDAVFLETLPDPEWRSGIAEAFKVALIRSAEYFDWLCKRADQLKARDMAAMEQLVVRCAELHLHHIRNSGDPFEQGEARPLDYGHWSAHQLETMTAYSMSHGQAVAIGIMLDALYAVITGRLKSNIADQLFDGLKRSGFTLWSDELDKRDVDGQHTVLAGLDRFREHLGGRLCITIPTGAGVAVEISEVDKGAVEKALAELKDRTARD